MSAADLKVLPVRGPQFPTAPRATPTPPVRFIGRRRWWAIAMLAALVAAGVAGEAWRASTAAMPVRYVTTAVTRGAVTRAVTASGSVNPEITIQVGTYVSGVIQELRCDYNTQVRKGQLCAKIDPRPYQMIADQDEANLSAAKAQLAKDETNVAYARLTYERAAGLRERGIVSQDALDGAKSAYDQATAQVQLDKANVTQHEAALNAANINLGYTDIISPVDGTVVSRSVTMGQTVAASFQTPTLFLVATDLTKMQVDANVSESDIGGIKMGNTATFTVEAFPNHLFDGRVIQVRQAPQTVQNVVTYDVVISVRNPDLLLKPGMTATVRIIVDSRDDVVRVPDQALRYAPGGLKSPSAATAPVDGRARVWILRDGRPVAVPITIGLDDDTQTEVVRGEIKLGDEVVVSEQSGGGSAASRSLFFRL